MPSSTLIVIPTYNERDSLPRTIESLDRAGVAADVLVVDDGSPDGTGEWAADLARRREDVHVLRREGKSGLGTAYLAGFRWGLHRGYEVLCEMDADGSHRARDLPALLAAVEAGADLAIGSRWVPGGAVVNWPLPREVLSRGANIWVGVVMGLRVRDATAGFRAFRRRALERIDFDEVEARGYSFQVDMTRRLAAEGFLIEEVPIVFVEREHGESKMSRGIILEAMRLTARWGAERRAGQLSALASRVRGRRPRR